MSPLIKLMIRSDRFWHWEVRNQSCAEILSLHIFLTGVHMHTTHTLFLCHCTTVLYITAYYYYYFYNRFKILCLGQPRWVGTRRINHSGFCWSRHDGAAVAPAEPYASYLHFAPEDNHASTSSVRCLRAGCPSWHPTNSVKALKAFDQHLKVGYFWQIFKYS